MVENNYKELFEDPLEAPLRASGANLSLWDSKLAKDLRWVPKALRLAPGAIRGSSK